ncbi:MAG: hypothetical protein ACM3TR_20620 [Caulobacteraceae bacterium]
MKKTLLCLLVIALCFSTVIVAFASDISASNYKVFQAWCTDYGYKNWGITSNYVGNLVTGTSNKTISEHDVLVYIQSPNYDYGTGEYFMTALTVYADSSQIAKYYTLDELIRDYILPSPIYIYDQGGIASGVSFSNIKEGKVQVNFMFNNDGWAAVGSWSNTLTKTF